MQDENTMEKLNKDVNGSSLNIVQDNLDKLKTLFPDIFSEGKIDFDKLRETLGNYLETDEERYNFTWHGKSKARRIAQTVSTGTLRPCKAESKHWDTTQNLFIEGDNLEVLKLLQKSYHKQVKMIYIDPPYNTGKEFIYPDNYQDNLDTYLEYTAQKDGEGRKFGTNAETSGRYHTNWLNMMYPRLKLARNLLCDDGVIFISIDDNEVANLRKLCDEIFGEENFLAEFIWKKRTGSNDAQNMVSLDHDYVMAFSKTSTGKLNGEIKDSSNYKNPDSDPRGPWARDNLTCNKTASERPNLYYPITDPKTGIEYQCNPNRVWAYEKDRMDRNISEGKVLFPQSGSGTPMYKRHLSELRSDRKPFSSLIDTVINTVATKETRELLGGQLFDYPKSVDLIKKLVNQSCIEQDLILDFFSGSCTTGHAVMDLNAQDNGNRKFIMVQLPEPCDKNTEAFKAGYQTIADIGNLDIGFKVFKLSSSNIKPWDADFDTLENALLSSVDNIKDDRSQDDVLYEILLKYGVDLTVPIEERQLGGKTVYSIGFGALVICLDDAITLDVVEAIGGLKAELEPEVMRVVFKDSGFKDDVVKTNAIQILKKYGIDDVKSL
jgi:adenine-specific DNA-methyltransferase